MTISDGTVISHYRILSRIGAGGMGEVYLARDTRLDRRVALKVLPAEVASDHQCMRRFVQEARAASALNHPNVAHIYEIGEINGISFTVMEYVEGQTLNAEICGHPLDLTQIVDIGIQVADALDEAHSKGITHRDIKPTNIMITPRGQVKVLDFGLAKVIKDTTGEASTQVNTSSGMIVGTVPYMSPEQALGREVDHRTDIFSLGVVLYEMATGTLPFKGDTIAVVFDAILHKAPTSPLRLNPELPVELERIVNKALEKDRQVRYQTASDLQADLKRLKRDMDSGREAAVSASARAAHAPARPRLASRSVRLTALAALVLFVGAALWVYFSRLTSKPPAPPLRIVPLTSSTGHELQPAFSSDGRQVAFVWSGEKNDNADIYVKLIDAGTPLRLTTNPAYESDPAWSPDGRYVAFLRESGIYLVPALGGPERKLAEVGIGASGLDWSPDGKFLAVGDKSSTQDPLSIFLLSANGGEKRRLTWPPAKSVDDNNPVFSPDGRTLAFSRNDSPGVQEIYLVPVAGGEPRRLTFDHQRIGGLTWTPDGREIVFSSNRVGSLFSLWRVPVSGGRPELLAGVGKDAYNPSISRQGYCLAYVQRVLNTNIWRVEVPSSTGRSSPPTKLITSSMRTQAGPQFSPDGKRIAFQSTRSGSYEIWVCDSEGLNPVQLTFFGGPLTGTPRWSPDGLRIAFDSSAEGNGDIYVINAEGGSPRRLTTEMSEEKRPSWSRDGRWIYFASNRGGTFQVWKMPAEGGRAVQVTKQGGFEAFESLDGEFVYYTKGRNEQGLWRVPVQGGEEIKIPDLHKAMSGYWAVADQGIYFLNPGAIPVIEFFNFDTGQVTQIAAIEKGVPPWDPGLAVSPDGRWILYAQVDQYGRNIILVENFR